MFRPSVAEILAEWIIADPGSGLGRWHEGLGRYESGTLAHRGEVDEAAELMCAGLTHFLAGEAVATGWAGEPPEAAIARTIWNVLAATVPSDAAGLSAASARRLRLALAAVRQCGYQAQDLGGNGYMEGFFDAGSRQVMTLALASSPGVSGTSTSADLPSWFSEAKTPDPCLNMPPAASLENLEAAVPEGAPGDPSVTASTRRVSAAAAATWAKNAARQAHQHVNPVVLQHSIEAVQDALIESKVAKVDKKTGRLKVRKTGIAKAAIRPGQTLRKAIDGAAVTDRLKSYNETVRALPAASTPEEFASYPSKRDFLRDWARRLIVAAEVTPTGPLVDSYTNAAAQGICAQVFIPLGAPRGISDISQYFHPEPVPAGTAEETFDALYIKVAMSQEQRHNADQQITAFLNSSRDQWINRIRQQHG